MGKLRCLASVVADSTSQPIVPTGRRPAQVRQSDHIQIERLPGSEHADPLSTPLTAPVCVASWLHVSEPAAPITKMDRVRSSYPQEAPNAAGTLGACLYSALTKPKLPSEGLGATTRAGSGYGLDTWVCVWMV